MWSTSPTFVTVLNPDLETVRRYGPGGRSGKLYSPSLFVTVDRMLFVSVLVISTVASGTAASEASTTRPETLAAPLCAGKLLAANSKPQRISIVKTPLLALVMDTSPVITNSADGNVNLCQCRKENRNSERK